MRFFITSFLCLDSFYRIWYNGDEVSIMKSDERFAQYPSNTYVGSCNNFMLFAETEREITARMYFRVTDAGKFPYRFWFCNAVDSTFSDGSQSRANLYGQDYRLIEASAGIAPAPELGAAVPLPDSSTEMTRILFDGAASRDVEAGESYWSDEIVLDVPKDAYLVFQWTVRGRNMAYTPDKIFPCFVLENGEWKPSNECPQPVLVGAARPVRKRVCFWGDSITMGLGTTSDAYEFWVADIARHFPDVGVWNIGLGYGRGEDAATAGVWFQKAKTADFVNICFGVNDIGQYHDAERLKRNLRVTVDLLKAAGVPCGIFTIPPFDYQPEAEAIWRDVDAYIQNELAPDCVYCFDTSLYWGQKPPKDHMAAWGGHPNGAGCAVLADAFAAEIRL